MVRPQLEKGVPGGSGSARYGVYRTKVPSDSDFLCSSVSPCWTVFLPWKAQSQSFPASPTTN